MRVINKLSEKTKDNIEFLIGLAMIIFVTINAPTFITWAIRLGVQIGDKL